MNAADRARLVEAVQRNCHIADARHAADMTLCIYLLQMREYFRWERGAPFGAVLAREEIGAWIAERELLWSSLEDAPFVTLPCPGMPAGVDAFDVAAMNRHLLPAGLLYGAGLAASDRPVFFLAELHSTSQREGLAVLSADRELARGLLAPPAALDATPQAPAIVLRREAIARWGWEKFETYALRRLAGSALHAAVQAYDFERGFDAALPRWLVEQGEALVLHEIGEHRAGELLGPTWAALRLSLPTRRGDLYARAVRDQLADFIVTLPTLLERDATASIHVWFANYDGVRELLFPTLKNAYAAWRAGDGGRALRHAIAEGKAHFTRLAQRALDLHAREGARAGAAIETMLMAPDAVMRD
ncbi:MAG: Sfum_1244 family protein [Burkholderiales bacterium]